MKMGINRADKANRALFESREYENNCVFISHKYEDLEAAREIADFIKISGIDVYLDDNDNVLQKAVDENNSQKIVNCIEEALMLSTHILILVTENTRSSWWVSYETGYAKKGDKSIASLLLKNVDEFPDFLKIEKTLEGYNDLQSYLANISSNDIFLESEQFSQITRKNALLKYINE